MGARHQEQAQAARIPIGRLRVHPRNIRTRLTQLEELAASIRHEGVIEPLVAHRKFMRQAGQQDLELIAGHRRLAAAQIVGLRTVPVIVLPTMRDDEVILAMISENVARVAVEPDDLSRAVRTLRDEFHYDQATIAERVGISVDELAVLAPGGRQRRATTPGQPAARRATASAPGLGRRTPRITPTRIHSLLAELATGGLTADEVCDRLRGALGGWQPATAPQPSPRATVPDDPGSDVADEPDSCEWAAGAGTDLTNRELQVLRRMARGMSNGQIGSDLYLSEDTVKTHARRLFRKIDVTDRAQAVAVGIARGLILLPADATPTVAGRTRPEGGARVSLTDPDTPDSTTAGAIALCCAAVTVLFILLAVAIGHPGPMNLAVAAAVIGGIHAYWWADERSRR